MKTNPDRIKPPTKPKAAYAKFEIYINLKYTCNRQLYSVFGTPLSNYEKPNMNTVKSI